jgi:hypothetical protein
MVSTDLPPARLIEPVVILLVPQPAVAAASPTTKAVVKSRFPVLRIVRSLPIGFRLSFCPADQPSLACRHRLSRQRNILLTLTVPALGIIAIASSAVIVLIAVLISLLFRAVRAGRAAKT